VFKTKSSKAKSAKHGGSKASGKSVKGELPPKAPKGSPYVKEPKAPKSDSPPKAQKAKSLKTKSQKIHANALELEELNKAMGEEMAKSNEVIAEMIELLSEEDGISEVVAPEPDSEPVTASIVSSYNTSAGSSQAAWSGGVVLVAALTGVLVLFF